MEDTVMDIMYETPSDESIEECIINEDVVNGLADAEIKYSDVINKSVKKNNGKTA